MKQTNGKCIRRKSSTKGRVDTKYLTSKKARRLPKLNTYLQRVQERSLSSSRLHAKKAKRGYLNRVVLNTYDTICSLKVFKIMLPKIAYYTVLHPSALIYKTLKLQYTTVISIYVLLGSRLIEACRTVTHNIQMVNGRIVIPFLSLIGSILTDSLQNIFILPFILIWESLVTRVPNQVRVFTKHKIYYYRSHLIELYSIVNILSRRYVTVIISEVILALRRIVVIVILSALVVLLLLATHLTLSHVYVVYTESDIAFFVHEYIALSVWTFVYDALLLLDYVYALIAYTMYYLWHWMCVRPLYYDETQQFQVFLKSLNSLGYTNTFNLLSMRGDESCDPWIFSPFIEKITHSVHKTGAFLMEGTRLTNTYISEVIHNFLHKISYNTLDCWIYDSSGPGWGFEYSDKFRFTNGGSEGSFVAGISKCDKATYKYFKNAHKHYTEVFNPHFFSKLLGNPYKPSGKPIYEPFWPKEFFDPSTLGFGPFRDADNAPCRKSVRYMQLQIIRSYCDMDAYHRINNRYFLAGPGMQRFNILLDTIGLGPQAFKSWAILHVTGLVQGQNCLIPYTDVFPDAYEKLPISFKEWLHVQQYYLFKDLRPCCYEELPKFDKFLWTHALSYENPNFPRPRSDVRIDWDAYYSAMLEFSVDHEENPAYHIPEQDYVKWKWNSNHTPCGTRYTFVGPYDWVPMKNPCNVKLMEKSLYDDFFLSRQHHGWALWFWKHVTLPLWHHFSVYLPGRKAVQNDIPVAWIWEYVKFHSSDFWWSPTDYIEEGIYPNGQLLSYRIHFVTRQWPLGSLLGLEWVTESRFGTSLFATGFDCDETLRMGFGLCWSYEIDLERYCGINADLYIVLGWYWDFWSFLKSVYADVRYDLHHAVY